MSILDRSIRDTPYAAVAIKTTGLTHSYDRIVEVAVALAEPGQPTRLILDTIVNPGRKMAGAEIHGIHDFSINALAPTFEEVALDLLRQLQGRVLVGHNLHFTLRFLKAEFGALGIEIDPPFLDTMSLTSMLTKKPQRPLLEACDQMGLDPSLEPTAAAAAIDTAKLLRALLQKLHALKLKTFRHIQGKKTRPFQQSLERELLPKGLTHNLQESVARISRHDRGVEGNPNLALALYWDALLVALDDLVITEAELRHLHTLKTELELDVDDIYMLHARVFSAAVVAMIDSGTCTEEDRAHLASLHECLARLGWAPGTYDLGENEDATEG